VRSILNKLTPQKFNQLMKQVTDLTIDTEERLKGVIDLVFEKAVDEPSFSAAYGNMCRCLATVSRSRCGKRKDNLPSVRGSLAARGFYDTDESTLLKSTDGAVSAPFVQPK